MLQLTLAERYAAPDNPNEALARIETDFISVRGGDRGRERLPMVLDTGLEGEILPPLTASDDELELGLSRLASAVTRAAA